MSYISFNYHEDSFVVSKKKEVIAKSHILESMSKQKETSNFF